MSVINSVLWGLSSLPRARVDLPGDRPLKVAVISDTHSAPHKEAMEHLWAEKADLCLHAGDMGNLALYPEYESLAEQFYAVRGNCDGHDCGFPDERAIDFYAGDELRSTWWMSHVAIYGGIHLSKSAFERAQHAGAQLVICGHSHMPALFEDRGLTVFNPGSIGPMRPGLPLTYGVIEISEAGIEFRHVEGHSGERWLPPQMR